MDDEDRDSFLEPLGGILLESSTPCNAWSLLSNHAHFLLRTGNIPLSSLMRKLLTGYAVTFNRRYHHDGHLFQNRYKSILCEEDVYLKELVRYIHLNPLRAGLFGELRELGSYAYSGHCVLMGKRKREWQGTWISPSAGSKSIARGREILEREAIEEDLLECQ